MKHHWSDNINNNIHHNSCQSHFTTNKQLEQNIVETPQQFNTFDSGVTSRYLLFQGTFIYNIRYKRFISKTTLSFIHFKSNLAPATLPKQHPSKYIIPPQHPNTSEGSPWKIAVARNIHSSHTYSYYKSNILGEQLLLKQYSQINT